MVVPRVREGGHRATGASCPWTSEGHGRHCLGVSQPIHLSLARLRAPAFALPLCTVPLAESQAFVAGSLWGAGVRPERSGESIAFAIGTKSVLFPAVYTRPNILSFMYWMLNINVC